MLLSQLNDVQKQAATQLDQPVCILAGAGTGKTRVITHRIAYLIAECGVLPESILAVTFTNKAASEMRERIERLLPHGAHSVQLGTFHGLGAKFLRRYGPRIGVKSDFLIYDQDDARRILQELAEGKLNIAKDRLDLFQSTLEDWQNQGLFPQDIPKSDDMHTLKARELYAAYSEKLSALGALDFNSILLKWWELLQHDETFAAISRRIRHVLVDEYQDTNKIQSKIIHRLAKFADSCAVVGDDDQAIYGWRGADANHMQQFLTDMPNALLVKLEENYRSTSPILHVANQLIAKNTHRLGKNLFTQKERGAKVRVLRARDDRQEAQDVLSEILRSQSVGSTLDDFAILMRTNAQSRVFEEALRRARIGFRLVGGVRFYDRKEVKDVLSVLRCAFNPASDLDTLRAINAVPRGVGKKSLEKVQEVAKTMGISLLQVFSDATHLCNAGLSKRTMQSVLDFSRRIEELRDRAFGTLDVLDAGSAVALAIALSGVQEHWQASSSDEARARLENLEQLAIAAEQYVEEANQLGQDVSARSFLEASALLSLADDNFGEDFVGKVTLMTLHAAKGLEFEHVFLVGLEEYGFPHARALDDSADESELEEERRLAYVGVTRAKKNLTISYAMQRLIHGQIKMRAPSRFLYDLPAESVQGDLPSKGPATHFSGFVKPPSSSHSSVRIDIDPEYQRQSSELAYGARVWHASFGEGFVLESRQSGQLQLVVVRFQDGSKRAIVSKHLQVL